MLLIDQVISQLFSGTDFKITCQQEFFSYLETLFFCHVAFCILFPFHPQSKFLQVEQRQSIVLRSPGIQTREGTLQVPMQCVTFVLLLLEQRESWSMPSICLVVTYPQMRQINKHKRPSRVSNFFIAFSVTCDL